MAKFNTKTAVRQRPTALRSPVQATGTGAVTFEGGDGFSRDAKSDLFLLAVTNMVKQDTFYESGDDRDTRFAQLVHQATQEDPEWVRSFLPYLRSEMFMRSASVVAVAEYIAAGGPEGRSLIASTLKRADEPAELLAYWIANYGRALPMPLKRGLADSVNKLYTQDSVLKYDGQGQSVRMGDVVELVHPSPKTNENSKLFKYVLDRRHHPQEAVADQSLTRLNKALSLDKLSEVQLREVFKREGAEALAGSGYTWERLSGKMKMDAEAWEAVIPQMGYMALLRNLRNFNDAGISAAVANWVVGVLTDADRVAKSMQFPYRFYSAYKATQDLHYAQALEVGLELSTRNIPALRGRSLILIDVSGSMQAIKGDRSSIAPWEKGALFGVAQFKKAENADLVAYGTRSAAVPLTKRTSVLRGIEGVREYVQSGRLDHGTETFAALQEHYDNHDRVVIFSDMQSSYHFRSEQVIKHIPAIYNFNLGGFPVSNMATGAGRYEFGGFSDAAFRMMEQLENLTAANWPWEK